jgi:putative endonuclease
MNPVRPACPVRKFGLSVYKNGISNGAWYYTYVLLSETKGNLYTGTTKNLNQRLKQHNDGLVFSSKNIRPLQLIYFESCLNKDDAYRRERYLKSGMGKRYLRNRLRGGLTG